LNSPQPAQAPADTPIDTPIDINHHVRGEQIALLYKQAPAILIGSAAVACVLVYMLWNNVAGHMHLLGWLVVFEFVIVLRALSVYLYQQDVQRLARRENWGRIFAIGSGAMGVAWGYLGWVFFATQLEVLIPIVLVFFGLTALSVTSAGLFYPAHVTFAVPCLSPLILRMLLQGENLYTGQGLALAIGLAACLIFARRFDQSVGKTIRLQFENLELLQKLRDENERVKIAGDLAQKANAAKARFLAAASHDLRQPVQAMLLFVLELRRTADHPPTPELVGNLQSACDAQRSLLDALLDMSTADSSVAQPQLSEFPLAPLLERIRIGFADLAKSKQLNFRVLPTNRWTYSDPSMLERIMRNLVANAVRHTKQGNVIVACRGQGDVLRLQVWDTGPGIPTDRQEEVFDEFVQLGNPERDHRKGLGLGLPIVKGLTRALEHPLHLRSNWGQGTVFTLELPAASPRPLAAIENAHFVDHLLGRCIALVEDETLIREGMKQVLTGWGCHVVCGETAEDIIAASPGREISAILADFRLRENRTGPDEIAKLRRHYEREIPAALLSGETAPELLSHGYPVLRKPAPGFKLRALLTSLLVE